MSLEALVQDHAELNKRVLKLQHEVLSLVDALSLFRSLVKENGVPRYTVNPGAALNALLEETVDPLLRRYRK